MPTMLEKTIYDTKDSQLGFRYLLYCVPFESFYSYDLDPETGKWVKTTKYLNNKSEPLIYEFIHVCREISVER